MSTIAPYEIVFSQSAWESAIRRLTVETGLTAVGDISRNSHRTANELLVRSLTIATEFPKGRDRAPLADWIVVVLGDKSSERIVERVGNACAPRIGQLLAVLVLGLGTKRDGWTGGIFAKGTCQPIDAIRVVGPGMLYVRRKKASAKLLADCSNYSRRSQRVDPNRWSRLQGSLGKRALRKLHRASVVVFGASRNGSAVAGQLAALGVRKLTLVDFDILEDHNLDCNRMVAVGDIGRKKVNALAKRLVAFRPDLAVTALACSATDEPAIEAVRACDLLVTAVDRDTPRLAAAILANRFLKIHLDIGTGVTRTATGERQLAGDCRLLIPGGGCCCCVGGMVDEAAARYELFAPPGAMSLAGPSSFSQSRLGSLITLNELTVSASVQLWIDLLTNDLKSSHWTRLRWFPGHGLQVNEAAVMGAIHCQTCAKLAATHVEQVI